MMEQIRSNTEIHFQSNGLTVAHFEDSGNGMEGDIVEGDNARLDASDLIALATWILEKAEDRARERD